MALLEMLYGSVIGATGAALEAVIEANIEMNATKVAIMSLLMGLSFVLAKRPFKPVSIPRTQTLTLQKRNVPPFCPI
jgi:hypothetical protein